MDITYFHWAESNGPSIVKSFRPLIDKMKETENVKEYRVPYHGSLPWNMIRNIVFVYKNRSKKGINHITGDIHYCVLGLIGCISILTIHDDYAIVKAHRGVFDKIYKWIFWIYLPIKFSDEILCISEATKYKIDRLLKNRKTKVLSHHVTGKEFKYIYKYFNENCPVVLQIGTSPQKNLETTLKALSGMRCKLRIVKKMTEEQHLLAKSFGINYSNVFNLSDEEIAEEYIHSDVVVFPSLYEGFGMPIIEGQAVGRVVITSDREPMKSVSGGAAVLLKNPLDVQEYSSILLRVFRDTSFRKELILAGLKNAKKYTVSIPMEKFLSLYRQYITPPHTLK
jgi:glycosyltransferase involved in cell wall biosynthesis